MEKYFNFDENHWRKINHTYTFPNGSRIQFFSVDSPQKAKGARRHYLYVNEAMDFSYKEFRQLSMRTKRKIFMDYNPEYSDSWIYDHVLSRKDCKMIHSTYLDNAFLTAENIRDIERIKKENKELWSIFGLGLPSAGESIIYHNFEVREFTDDEQLGMTKFYGLDFGHNHPTVLIELFLAEATDTEQGVLFVKVLNYERKQTNTMLIKAMEEMDIDPFADIFCDSEDANRIQEIIDAGYYSAVGVKKPKGSVLDGIDICKRHKIVIHPDNSQEFKQEIKGYRWKEDRNGNLLDQPVKHKDDGMDAMRYGAYGYSTTILTGGLIAPVFPIGSKSKRSSIKGKIK